MLLGGDLDAALSRLGDRALLIKHLRQFPGDDAFPALKRAVTVRDQAAAWQAAHALRGTCLTLGMGRLAKAAERVMDAEDWPERDATLAVLACEQEHAARVIGLLEENGAALAMLLHELRTPLQVMLGTAEARPEDVGMARIATAARHLSAVLSGLSKLSAGQSPRRVSFSLPELLQECAELLHGAFAGRSVAVATSLRHERVQGDPASLRQALLNLLTNAVRNSPESDVIILEAAELDGVMALSVRDHGRGMTDAEREQACEPYWRGGEGPGMGLGLTIVRELTERMGGRMTIESAPGEGTTVTLRLPLPPSDDVERGTGRVEKSRRFDGMRVLLAEDDRLNAEVSVELFEGLGLRTSMAHDGGEAVKLAGAGGYDCAFLDAHMPGLDGSAAEAICRALPDAPVFALTAGLLPGEEQRLRAAGVRACLLKPVGPDALARLLGDWFPDR